MSEMVILVGSAEGALAQWSGVLATMGYDVIVFSPEQDAVALSAGTYRNAEISDTFDAEELEVAWSGVQHYYPQSNVKAVVYIPRAIEGVMEQRYYQYYQGLESFRMFADGFGEVAQLVVLTSATRAVVINHKDAQILAELHTVRYCGRLSGINLILDLGLNKVNQGMVPFGYNDAVRVTLPSVLDLSGDGETYILIPGQKPAIDAGSTS